MSNPLVTIVNFKTGFDTYDQPEVMPDDASPQIFDVVPYRGVLQKRDGNISLVDPSTFKITAITQAANALVTTSQPHGYSIGDLVTISEVFGMTEINNEDLQPYSVVTVPTGSTFTINLDTTGFSAYTSGGIVQKTKFVAAKGIQNVSNADPAVITTYSNHNLQSNQLVFIDNVEGVTGINSLETPYVVTVLTSTTFSIPFDGTGSAYTQLGVVLQPIQSLCQRQTTTFFKDLIAFTQNQAYLFSPSTNEFNNISGSTVWNGVTTDFFWWLNYVNSFWATNALDPIRYYISGTLWTDFRPILFGTSFTQNPGNIPPAAVSFGPFVLANTPIIPGTVRVTIAAGATEPQVILTDDGSGNLTSVTAGYTGTVDYVTGSTTLTAVVADANARAVTVRYDQQGDRLESALLIFSYYDRMIALNTSEGAGFVNHPERVRYSQNGTPYVSTPVPSGVTFNAQSWRQDVPGRGGFIDAPTDERIITAGFVKDVLVVAFEFSIWRLRYTGNEAIPFVWERIKSSQGAESTYSTVLFDEGILTVGRTGILLSTTNASQRIDEIIPDQIFQISNVDNAQKQVQGIRDLQRQLVYWTYPEVPGGTFPDRAFVFNYIEKCWTIYRQNFTCFGYFRLDDDLTWGEAERAWAAENSFWNAGSLASGFPSVVAGNPFGKVVRLDDQYNNDDGTVFNFNFTTKKFNPFFSQGLQCKAIYMYLLVAGTDQGQFTIEHYIDQSLNVPVATYTVNTNSAGEAKVWRRIALSANSSQYQQFIFKFSDNQLADQTIAESDIEIYQLLIEFAPAGRLNYGEF